MSELNLFFSPRACSLACHIALEESGLPFTTTSVKIRKGEHKQNSYKKVNPWGKIPSLVVGQEVLTETHEILSYIGDSVAATKQLLPQKNPLQRARAHEWMNFLSSTVHIAFRPLFRPNLLVDQIDLYPELRKVGIPNLKKTLLEVERRLEGKTWALGDTYSICDPYLFVFHMWSQREDVIEHVADMPNWMLHRERMNARPATQSALIREGITPENIILK